MQAASQNRLNADYMAILLRAVFSMSWAISAGVAAVAGILLSPVSMIDVNMGFLGIKAFAAAVIGGVCRPFGGVVLGGFFGVLGKFSRVFFFARGLEVVPPPLLLRCFFLPPPA